MTSRIIRTALIRFHPSIWDLFPVVSLGGILWGLLMPGRILNDFVILGGIGIVFWLPRFVEVPLNQLSTDLPMGMARKWRFARKSVQYVVVICSLGISGATSLVTAWFIWTSIPIA